MQVGPKTLEKGKVANEALNAGFQCRTDIAAHDAAERTVSSRPISKRLEMPEPVESFYCCPKRANVWVDNAKCSMQATASYCQVELPEA